MNQSRPIRILFPFAAKFMGGGLFSALNLLTNLDRRAFEPVVVLHEMGPFADYLRERDIPFQHLPVAPYFKAHKLPIRGFELLRTVPPLVRFLSKTDIDIVHTNQTRTHLTWATPARRAGRRFVWHVRTKQFAKRRRTYMDLAQNADRILCVSEYIRETVPAHLRARSRAVYNPFDTLAEPPDRARNRQRLVDELGLPARTAIIGFFANFQERKKPMQFVEAAGRIAAALDRPTAFLMFGADKKSFTARLRKRAREVGIADRLHLMGFRVPVEEFMAGCELMLVPAVDEPFGRTLVEASLVGTPMVATLSGGNLEFVKDGETGVLVPPEDPEALARAALDLLNDPEAARRMVARAGEETRKRLSIAAHVDQVSAVYRELMAPDLAQPRGLATAT